MYRLSNQIVAIVVLFYYCSVIVGKESTTLLSDELDDKEVLIQIRKQLNDIKSSLRKIVELANNTQQSSIAEGYDAILINVNDAEYQQDTISDAIVYYKSLPDSVICNYLNETIGNVDPDEFCGELENILNEINDTVEAMNTEDEYNITNLQNVEDLSAKLQNYTDIAESNEDLLRSINVEGLIMYEDHITESIDETLHIIKRQIKDINDEQTNFIIFVSVLSGVGGIILIGMLGVLIHVLNKPKGSKKTTANRQLSKDSNFDNNMQQQSKEGQQGHHNKTYQLTELKSDNAFGSFKQFA